MTTAHHLMISLDDMLAVTVQASSEEEASLTAQRDAGFRLLLARSALAKEASIYTESESDDVTGGERLVSEEELDQAKSALDRLAIRLNARLYPPSVSHEEEQRAFVNTRSALEEVLRSETAYQIINLLLAGQQGLLTAPDTTA